jgi:hypothetical protein
MQKLALLVGIDRYPHVPPLDGCVNDVTLMRSVLMETFGFPDSQITLITNEQATRDRILEAFDALIAATGPDDIVVVHYAGHGSQMTDREGDEPSGFDSTLMPVDSARAPGENRDITDDEIHLKLEALGEQTSFATLVIDACHSGTITRDVFGGKARAVEPDRRPASELPPSPIPPERRQRARSSGASGWMPLAEKYVLIAGCRDEERSYEYRPPEGEGAVAHGALSYFLCQQLRRATPGTSYRDVFERAAALVNAENGEQHPQMEGKADREVFGVRDLTPATFVRIVERDGDLVVLAAGAAHGVTVGSTYGVFPQGTKDPKSGSPLGEVAITAVRVATADARVVRETTPGLVGPDARAFESSHAFGDFRLAVQLVESSGAEPAALAAAVDRSPLLKVVADGPAAARLYLLPARTEVSAGAAVPQAGILDRPRWAVVSQSGDLLMPLKDLGDEATVVQNLETIAKYRQALALDNPDPASALKGRFTLELLRRSAEGTWSVALPETDGGQIVYDEGDAIAFRVTSRHDAPVYVSLIDFGLSGAIAQVFPPRGAQDALGANVSFEIGTRGPRPSRLTWPVGYPYIDSADHLREAEGVETLKLIVTEQPADFFALEQQGVRSAGASAPPSPLALLLRNAFGGRTTRDIAMADVGGEDWTTLSRSFVVRRRTSASLPLDGAAVEVGGATISAPGLSGTLQVSLGKRRREEAGRQLSPALVDALSVSSVETRQTIQIANAQERGPASRSVGDQPALELRLPDPGPGHGQMVMAVDELGVVSWSFAPQPAERAASRGLARAAERTYVVPRTVPPQAAPSAGSRGLVSAIGTKVLKELVFPLIDPVVGEITATFVNRLERQRSPYRVRTFTPDDYTRDEAQPIDADGWSRLASGRSLLMVHGTFSRAHLAFAQLPTAYVETLHRLYDGRVIAFDHFTLSHDPKENVRWLVSHLPDAADLTLDIVCHSRGGLVSRLLSEKQAELSLGSRRVRIGKIVFVGAPCAGTALADPEHVGKVLDVFTNLMNFLPDNGVTDVMAMVVGVAKQLAVGALAGLDGLQSMRPHGEFATWLNTGARSGDTKYFAVASSVTPSDPGLRHFALSQGLNRVLQGDNDFVVPTEGVFAANGSGFFPIDDRLVLEGAGAVAHTKYFEDPLVRGRILEWLTA